MAGYLEHELDSLAESARAYDARHRRISGLTWPGGARIAVNFTADFDAMLLRRLLNEPPMQLAKGEFGGRVGIWRLIELFDRHGIKATIFTPGRIAELYPRALHAAHASGHEIADHMWEHHVPKDMQLELDHLTKTSAALSAITGRKPVGTRSEHTASLLKQEGFLYTSHDTADSLPYYLTAVRLTEKP
jgi:peptidoglycan/xylan/chitin deacetylase (PgdA/CDA1 family)